MRPVVPVHSLADRLPEHGRIRLGVKTGSAMRSIDTFRFTSPDRQAIEDLAERYGGKAQPWNDPRAVPPKQWQVISESSTIRIFLPPGSLSTWYELWAGGGRKRQCDGLQCLTFVGGREQTVPCVCHAEQNMKCRPYTRLNCIFPEIRFAGTWRLETKGWNAAKEIGAMEEILSQVQEKTRVPIPARLHLEQRSTMKEGKKSNFVVPRLEFEHSVVGLAAGEARASLGRTAPIAALTTGNGNDDDDEDVVVVAEVVEEEDVRPKEWQERIEARFKGNSLDERLEDGAAEIIRRYGFMGPDHDACLNRIVVLATKGKVSNWLEADEVTKKRMEAMFRDMVDGKVSVRQEGDAIRIVRTS